MLTRLHATASGPSKETLGIPKKNLAKNSIMIIVTSHKKGKENKIDETNYSCRSRLPSAKGFSGDISSNGRVALRSPVATPCPMRGFQWLVVLAECASRLFAVNWASGLPSEEIGAAYLFE